MKNGDCRRQGRTGEFIEEFLGSTQVFALALTDILEAQLLREIAGGQLTTAQVKVLRLIAMAGTQTIGDVAVFLGVSDAAASKAIDRLVKRRLLRRAEREDDRRTTEIALTSAGQKVVAAYNNARTRRLGRIFREFAPERLKAAADLFDEIAASIVEHSDNPEEICLQCGVNFRERCLLQDVGRRTCSYRKRASEHEQSGSSSGDES